MKAKTAEMKNVAGFKTRNPGINPNTIAVATSGNVSSGRRPADLGAAVTCIAQRPERQHRREAGAGMRGDENTNGGQGVQWQKRGAP